MSNTGTSYSRSFRSDLRNQAKRGAQPIRVAIALTGDRHSGEDLLRPEQEMGAYRISTIETRVRKDSLDRPARRQPWLQAVGADCG
jgi:hypothetical protein